MSYKNELKVAKKAARAAAKIIRDYAEDSSFNVSLKGVNDLVTDADLASEKKIIECIKEYFPGDEVLAEESEQKDKIPEGRIWIIDPIDGTTNFAHGFPAYCISIALWENKEPLIGLVMEVANNELFHAVKGRGAFRNGDPIQVSDETAPSSALIGTGFPYKELDLIDNYLKLFKRMMGKTHGVRRPGTAAWDLCNVACGRFEGFYEYGLSAWDVAAGSLIIKEAGGRVTDWKGGNDWLFGKRIVAGNEPIADFLVREIKKCFNENELSE
ncbi:inositol monophosphatase family protein [Gracilimonas sp. Q87]|uniref:inositol monophosphatase family protein n=1 Tax=Gracilimonas sp. Q87 TaxID=3384766 RepID=UPI003983EE34